MAKDGKSFWFQTNSENPDQDIGVNISCPHRPGWQIEPASAAKEARWDDATKTLCLCLSHRQGAVEVKVN